jgi:citrate lyase subunit beta/citryl-CoA lyase
MKKINNTGVEKPAAPGRSDCKIDIQPKKSGGVKVTVKGKVSFLYGKNIEEMILDMCKFFFIKNADVIVEDTGALPFTIAARFEAAYKKDNPEISGEYLLPFNPKNQYGTVKDRIRRSRLYLPGNEPKYFINAGLHKPDSIIYDLEDSINPAEKVSARLLVRNALRSVDLYGAERMVRINPLPFGLDDVRAIVPHNVHVILIPKCESAENVLEVEYEVQRIKEEENLKHEIYLIPIIESALGIVNSYQVASASKRVCALSIGLEDYTADLGAERTNGGKESLYARCEVINSAKAAGIQALDSVFSNIDDMEELKASVLEAKALGFEGKGCIHPRQINTIHEFFAPAPDEIERAKKIITAYSDALQNNLGVVSLGNKMIDAPVMKRAVRIIELAQLNNLIEKDWNK